MFLVGGLLSLPLVIGLLVLAAGQWYDSWILVVLCTFAVPGLALLWNAYMSTIDLT
jgi:hypothetical protein